LADAKIYGTWVLQQTWINLFHSAGIKEVAGSGANVLYAKSNLDYDAAFEEKADVRENIASMLGLLRTY
jgi:hypothetical protein